MIVSAAKGLAFQRRTAAGGLSVSTAGPFAAAPRWVRLDRAGSTLSAYQSADGVNWSIVGTDTIPMPVQVLVGLPVSSHSAAAAATATFDHVAITPASPSPPSGSCPVTLQTQSTIVGAGTPGTATSATWYIHVGADACTWTARSDVDWLEIKNPAGVYVHLTDVSFTGTTDMKVHALTNAGPKRVGHFLINGVAYTVTQGGT